MQVRFCSSPLLYLPTFSQQAETKQHEHTKYKSKSTMGVLLPCYLTVWALWIFFFFFVVVVLILSQFPRLWNMDSGVKCWKVSLFEEREWVMRSTRLQNAEHRGKAQGRERERERTLYLSFPEQDIKLELNPVLRPSIWYVIQLFKFQRSSKTL